MGLSNFQLGRTANIELRMREDKEKSCNSKKASRILCGDPREEPSGADGTLRSQDRSCTAELPFPLAETHKLDADVVSTVCICQTQPPKPLR